MGKQGYVHGDYNVICDFSGQKIKRSEARKTWDGLLVKKEFWEPRHPQDFVRGKADKQTVADARPDQQTMHNEATVAAAASKDDTTIDITGGSSLVDGDGIGIVLDNGESHWTVLTDDPTGDVCPMLSEMPGAAAAGNVVYVPGTYYVGTNEVVAGDL